MAESDRLKDLEARIDAAKTAVVPPQKERSEEHHSQLEVAWRMVIELVAGLGIGFGIGFGLDKLFGTLPIFLILFTLLGLAAGIKTMLRSAQEMQKDAIARHGLGEKYEGPDDG